MTSLQCKDDRFHYYQINVFRDGLRTRRWIRQFSSFTRLKVEFSINFRPIEFFKIVLKLHLFTQRLHPDSIPGDGKGQKASGTIDWSLSSSTVKNSQRQKRNKILKGQELSNNFRWFLTFSLLHHSIKRKPNTPVSKRYFSSTYELKYIIHAL